MPSFYPSKGLDGPWVDPSIGDAAARSRFKSRMAQLKASLAQQLSGRRTLADNGQQTHEMSYTRYGPGARLPRHTDEHHSELKKAHPVASGDENVKRVTSLASVAAGSLSTAAATSSSSDAGGKSASEMETAVPSVPSKSSGAATKTRRSVTWLVYL